MEYLFSHLTDENKVQGEEVTSSEVIEPLSVGLEVEALIERAASNSKPHTLSTALDLQSPTTGRTKKP